MKQIGITERRAKTEDIIPLRMFRDGLHNSAVHNDQMLRSCVHGAALARITGVEEQRCTFEADPVTLPSTLPSELNLVFLTEKPLLDAQESTSGKMSFQEDPLEF